MRLEQAIREAWSILRRPASQEIVPATWGGYAECLDAFGGKDWSEVTRADAMSNRSCISFFTDEALVYYLPAFLLGSLEEKEGEWDLTEYTLGGIDRLLHSYSDARASLSGSQVEVIGEYLRYLLESRALTSAAETDVIAVRELFLRRQQGQQRERDPNNH